jgi:hypothetical protein
MVNINNSNNFSITKNFEHNKFVSALQTSMARLGLQYSCTKKSTSFDLMGRGEGGVVYLDRQAVECDYNELIKYFRLEHKNNRVRYNYECCRYYLQK